MWINYLQNVMSSQFLDQSDLSHSTSLENWYVTALRNEKVTDLINRVTKLEVDKLEQRDKRALQERLHKNELSRTVKDFLYTDCIYHQVCILIHTTASSILRVMKGKSGALQGRVVMIPIADTRYTLLFIKCQN